MFLFLLQFLILFGLSAQNCYELVWNDEFNYTGLPDSTRWVFEEGGNGWGNNELQYYTSKRPENAFVENGHLTITARKEDFQNNQYTSARLITYPLHSWQYGKIEARIKLPFGQGIWPAFWMLGDRFFEGTPWPLCGEIDIMEMIGGGEGRDDRVYGTMHYGDINDRHAEYGGNYQLSEGIYADTFHVFAVEWTPTQIKWYVNGIQYHIASLTQNYLTEFHNDFFILLNLAVGGNWPGSPSSSTVFPQKMQVDYVRVYQNNNQPEITGDTLVNKAQKNLIFKTVESEDFTYNWSVPDDAKIIKGQGTNAISVTWGCNPGDVVCELSANCKDYILSLPVKTENIKVTGNEKLGVFSNNNLFTVPELDSSEYYWEVPDDVSFEGRKDTNSVSLTWGNTEGYVKVSVNNNCGIEADSIFVSIVEQLPYPDPQTPHEIPGIIEAINYDTGGEGFAYHDSDPENKGTGSRQDEGVDTEPNDGGENIGFIYPGEWVEYTVRVEKTDNYTAALRVASLNGGGQMEIHFNDEVRTGKIDIPRTGSWTGFTTIYLQAIQLYDTDTIMKLHFNIGEFNISRIAFNNTGTSIPDFNSGNGILAYPNPVSNILYLKNQTEVYSYNIINIVGEVVLSGRISPGENINISELKNGIYFMNLGGKENSHTLKLIKQK